MAVLYYKPTAKGYADPALRDPVTQLRGVYCKAEELVYGNIRLLQRDGTIRRIESAVWRGRRLLINYGDGEREGIAPDQYVVIY